MAPYAFIRPAFLSSRSYLVVATLLCAAGMVTPGALRPVWAGECTAGPSPVGAAGTSALYGELADSVNAEPLSVDITARSIDGSCTWVYEVKILTATGSVALLDFDLVDLGLRRVEGAADDPEIAKLYERLISSDKADHADRNDASGSGPADDGHGDGSQGNDSGGSDSGDGSGGESGSDSDGGGSDGGSDGGEGGGDD